MKNNHITILTCLSQTHYVAGDQVDGEALIHVPSNLVSCHGIQFLAWCDEQGFWYETPDNNFTRRRTSAVSYHTLRPKSSPAVTNSNKFHYVLNHNTPATTYYAGADHRGSIRHYIAFRIFHKQDSINFDIKNDLISLIKTPESILDSSSTIHYTVREINVLERKQLQATLTPYTFQCTLTIPHIISSKDLKMILRKEEDAITAGAILPLKLEIQNSSFSKVTGFVVTLSHTISLRAYSGLFKSVTYVCALWMKSCNIEPNSPKVELAIPLNLPENLPPTSHGSFVTSEYNINVSCRYSKMKGLITEISKDDLHAPITIYSSVTNPKHYTSRNYMPWNILFTKPFYRLFIKEITEISDSMKPLLDLLKTEVEGFSDNVTNLEAVELDVGGGMATKKELNYAESTEETTKPKEILPSKNLYFTTPADIVEDIGCFMSPQLLQTSHKPKTVRMFQPKKTAKTTKARVVAPLSL